MKRKRIGKVILDIFLIIISLVIVIPLLTVLFNSFKTAPEAASFSLALPSQIHFENYKTVFETSNIGRAMFNGLFYSAMTIIVIMLTAPAAAFVIIRRVSKFNQFIYLLFIAGLIIPVAMIPTIWVTKLLNIYGTRFNLIMIYVALNLPLSMFIYSGFVKTIPQSLDEAVAIDGGGAITLFTKVIFPLLKPVNMTILLLVGTGIWNDFYFQIYFTKSSKMWAMPMTVYNYFGQYSREWNLVCADIMLAVLPVFILFVVFQKYIMDGMVVGAVKG